MRNCRSVICENLDCFADGIEVFSCTAIAASFVGTLVRGVSVLVTPACPALLLMWMFVNYPASLVAFFSSSHS